MPAMPLRGLRRLTFAHLISAHGPSGADFDRMAAKPYDLSLMSEALPERIDLERLAQQHAKLVGYMPLARMPRLQGVLCSQDGAANLDAQCSLDQEQRAIITGRVTATLCLNCQRCLGELHLPVKTVFSLALVASDADAAALPEQYEPLLTRTADCIALTELITDELLLALPMIPKHARSEDCDGKGRAPADEAQAPVARQNPFAVLAELKSDRRRD
jgi:uncharacterized protein